MNCLHKLLQDNGILFIEVPNILGNWSGIGMFHIAHVFQFHEASLKNFLARAGFSPVAISTEGNEIHPWAMSFICQKDPDAMVALPSRIRDQEDRKDRSRKTPKGIKAPVSQTVFPTVLQKRRVDRVRN